MTNEYIQKISKYRPRDLFQLWQQIGVGNTPDWPDGKAFEYLCLRAFQLEGAEVRWPYSVIVDGEEIEQIDGVIYAEGLSCLVECKDIREAVNFEPIAKLRNQLLRRPANVIGNFFSVKGFTEPATILARFVAPQTILLWDGNQVEYGLENKCMIKGLMAKYRYCVEHGLPNYDIRRGV